MSAPAARATLPPSRLLAADVVQVGVIGLRTRKLRAALSALGVAIGIASMVAVLGLSASSQADLLDTIDRLGTNLLTVQPGESFFGSQSVLPQTAQEKLAHIPGVEQVAASYPVSDVTVRRSQYVDPNQTGGISVVATDTNLLAAVSGELADGRFLDRASSRLPAVVLGATAARRLGIDRVTGDTVVYLSGRWFTVVGILKPAPLAGEVDNQALIGLAVARAVYDVDPHPSTLYLRADDARLEQVRGLVAGTAHPEFPDQVSITRPSDALEAKAAAKGAFTSLLLGLGAVALIVGGVGIANVMVISVLERRSEIGLRRALGATRRHISTQFVAESLILAGVGGVVGSVLGAIVTAIYSASKGQQTVVPVYAVAGGVGAAVVIGIVAGIYPALRASRLSPTEALRTV